MSNGRRFRRHAPDRSTPAPGDPNEPWQASVNRKAAQQLRRKDPVGYQGLKVAYLMLFVIPFGLLLLWALVVALARLIG